MAKLVFFCRIGVGVHFYFCQFNIWDAPAELAVWEFVRNFGQPQKIIPMKYLTYITMAAMALSACSNKEAAENDTEEKKETAADVLTLPQDFIAVDDGLEVSGYDDLASG